VRLFTASNPIIKTGGRESLLLYAKSLLQRILAGKYQGQITITGRAEIEPGRPVFIPIRNMVYYIETVSHSYSEGGKFTTTLHLSYGRKPWEHISELLTFYEGDEIYQTDGALYNELLSDLTISSPSTPYILSEQLSKHFTLSQFTYSKTAKTYGIDNTHPSNVEIENMKTLCRKVLEPVVSYMGKITITSGYRCKNLNDKMVSSKKYKIISSNSNHIHGYAADFTCANINKAYDYIKNNLVFNELIHEGSSIHVSYKEGANQRKSWRA
jgi:hypothetical protein